MAEAGGYNYKRVKIESIKVDRLCSPVDFTGVKAQKMRMSLLPKAKVTPTNPSNRAGGTYATVCDGAPIQGDHIAIVRRKFI
jgi:hypothetical protein